MVDRDHGHAAELRAGERGEADRARGRDHHFGDPFALQPFDQLDERRHGDRELLVAGDRPAPDRGEVLELEVGARGGGERGDDGDVETAATRERGAGRDRARDAVDIGQSVGRPGAPAALRRSGREAGDGAGDGGVNRVVLVVDG